MMSQVPVYKFLCVGGPITGKTAYIEILTSGDFVLEYHPTLGINIRAIRYRDVMIQLWEIGSRSPIDEEFVYKNVHGIIGFSNSFSTLGGIDELIRKTSVPTFPTPIVLVWTKCDIEQELKSLIMNKYWRDLPYKKFTISSYTGESIYKPIDELLAQIHLEMTE